MPDTARPPRVFFSYSHDDEQHKGWVLTLAARLVANGVDVILDRWNLSLGSDLARFMELGLSDSDRVIAVCTTAYVEKANRGIGGVGYEKMILTAQIMANTSKDRIIPVLRSNQLAALPTFLGPRLYLDFRDEAAYEQRYVELIRELHGERMIARPPIGNNPFSDGENPLLAFSRERCVSPEISGTVTFDYSNNDGIYTVGLGDLAFSTRWSRAWTSSIYAWRDGGGNIKSIALATGVSSLADLKDVSVFDDSSRMRQPTLGEIVVWRNRGGYYLATRVEKVSVRYGEWKDEMTFSYLIQPNRTPVFGR